MVNPFDIYPPVTYKVVSYMSELINLIKKLKIKDYSIVNGKIEYSEARYKTTNNSRVNLFTPFLVTSHPLKQEELPTAEDV